MWIDISLPVWEMAQDVLPLKTAVTRGDSFVIVGDVWQSTHMHVDMDVMARCYGDGSSFLSTRTFC